MDKRSECRSAMDERSEWQDRLAASKWLLPAAIGVGPCRLQNDLHGLGASPVRAVRVGHGPAAKCHVACGLSSAAARLFRRIH